MTGQPSSVRRDSLLGTLDHALRGGFWSREAMAGGRVDVPVRRLLALALLLAAGYGVCLGAYGLFRSADGAWLQAAAGAGKVPLLFALTLVVTFPSLYVFSALQRLPIGFASMLRLMLLAVLVHVAVAASLGPVFAFFAASTDSYPFLLLLNVAFFAIGGVLGYAVLRRAAEALHPNAPPPSPAATDAAVAQGAAARSPIKDTANGRARRALGVWYVVYAVVGAQMSWLLRPFVGAPGEPFALFREREGSWLTGVLDNVAALFRG